MRVVDWSGSFRMNMKNMRSPLTRMILNRYNSSLSGEVPNSFVLDPGMIMGD